MRTAHRLLIGCLAWTGLGLAGNAAAILPHDFADELVVGGLNQPAGFAFLPDGRILVVEQTGRTVRLVVEGTLVGTPLLTIADVDTSGGERGLLGVEVDSGWPTRPYVYFHFTRTPGNVLYISRFTAGGDLTDGTSSNLTLGSRYDILTDVPDNAQNHNGGTLRFGPDGMLYASFGEDSNNCAAQDSTDLRGVILRLDVSSLPDTGTGPPSKSLITPSDNPFPPTNPNAGLTFCFGHRNPFRFQIDPLTGKLYIADVGQRDYEEVDEAVGGENFGWPFREGPIVREPQQCTEPGGSGSQNYDAPIGGYDRTSLSSAAIIGGPRYRNVPGGVYRFPALYEGAVFYADYYSGFVRVLRENAGVWEPLPPVPGQPNADDWATGITYVGEFRAGPDGAIYYTKQSPGSIRRIVYALATGTGGEAGFGRKPMSLWPNPYRSGSGPLRVELGAALSGAEVRVFTLSGARIRTLAAPGTEGSALTWDGRDDAGRPVPAGVYFLSARVGDARAHARLIVLR